MKPKFATQADWENAELLMQPAMIRVVDHLRNYLEGSNWLGTYREVSSPVPGYCLDLKQGDQQVSVDIWELCYRICFANYTLTDTPEELYDVEVDRSLLDEEGDVDWERLDEKARAIVGSVFLDLPTVASAKDEPTME